MAYQSPGDVCCVSVTETFLLYESAVGTCSVAQRQCMRNCAHKQTGQMRSLSLPQSAIMEERAPVVSQSDAHSGGVEQ